MVIRYVPFLAASLRLNPHEENHEETQYIGDVDCLRSTCYFSRRTKRRQLAQCLGRHMEERQWFVLA